MDLLLMLIGAVLLPALGQTALLTASRRPGLAFARWLLLLLPLALGFLAAMEIHRDGIFSGLTALFYLTLSMGTFVGYLGGWLIHTLWKNRR